MTNQIENEYIYAKPFIYKCDQCSHAFEPIDKAYLLENPNSPEFHDFSCPNCGWRYAMRVQKDDKGHYLIRRDEKVESERNWIAVTSNAVIWPLLAVAALYMLKNFL